MYPGDGRGRPVVRKLTFKDQTVEISRSQPAVMIEERINPTGRKEVLAALEAGDFDSVRCDALAQVAAGAPVLNVNAGVPGADEPALLAQVLQVVMETAAVPLSIDTADPYALEAALKLYPGKALVNSVNGEEKVLTAGPDRQLQNKLFWLRELFRFRAIGRLDSGGDRRTTAWRFPPGFDLCTKNGAILL